MEPEYTAQQNSPLFVVSMLILCLAVLFRLVSLSWVPQQFDALSPSLRAEISDAIRALALSGDEGSLLSATRSLPTHLATLGITKIEVQQFDPSAKVVLRPGKDGQPGHADFDDDQNGVIDNREELGATYSDDECVVETSNEKLMKSVHREDSPVLLTIQRGAFYTLKRRDSFKKKYKTRVRVFLLHADDFNSFVVDI